MQPDELARYLDHTCLKATATPDMIDALCREARDWAMASVCVPPAYIREARARLRNTEVRVGTVIGFPFGYSASSVKLVEAKTARQHGAEELDVVLQLGRFKGGERRGVEEELRGIVQATPELTHKVIIECPSLTEEEMRAAVQIVLNAGAAFVKTSTGFGPNGARLEDVQLLVEEAAGRLQVKASGGIRTLDAALTFIEAGATRIGTSAAAEILSEASARSE